MHRCMTVPIRRNLFLVFLDSPERQCAILLPAHRRPGKSLSSSCDTPTLPDHTTGSSVLKPGYFTRDHCSTVVLSCVALSCQSSRDCLPFFHDILISRVVNRLDRVMCAQRWAKRAPPAIRHHATSAPCSCADPE